MPAFVQTILMIVVAVGSSFLGGYINIVIIFSQDEKTAKEKLWRIVSVLLHWILTLIITIRLIFTVTSSDPITRFVVFDIAFQTSTLMYMFISGILGSYIITILKEILNQQGAHLEITKDLTKVFSLLSRTNTEH